LLPLAPSPSSLATCRSLDGPFPLPFRLRCRLLPFSFPLGLAWRWCRADVRVCCCVVVDACARLLFSDAPPDSHRPFVLPSSHAARIAPFVSAHACHLSARARMRTPHMPHHTHGQAWPPSLGPKDAPRVRARPSHVRTYARSRSRPRSRTHTKGERAQPHTRLHACAAGRPCFVGHMCAMPLRREAVGGGCRCVWGGGGGGRTRRGRLDG
jgi:hypothetical protein